MAATLLPGPFGSIEDLCEDAKKTSPAAGEPCAEEPLPKHLRPDIEVPPSLLAVKLLEIGDPSRGAVDEASCVLALQTSKGWFHFTWHCEGLAPGEEYVAKTSAFHWTKGEDLIRTGAPELVVMVSESIGSEVQDVDKEMRLICDASDPAAPWCVGPLTVEQRIVLDDDTVKEYWTLKIAPTTDGFELKPGAEGTLTDDAKQQFGPYVVEPRPAGKEPTR